MPKLLSEKEAKQIAARMAAAYGLPSPRFAFDSRFGLSPFGVRVEILWPIRKRVFNRWSWPTKAVLTKVRDFYASDCEDALSKLQQELFKFDSRVEAAEQFREQYDVEEANAILDRVLKK